MDKKQIPYAKAPMQMCPMAPMFRRLQGGPGFGALMAIPGLVLITAGILIFIEPKIMIWLLAGAAILIGLGMLAFATIMRRVTARLLHERGG